MSLSQGDASSGFAIVTLHISPRNKESDTVIREAGANPKIVIRLLDHEPLFKLYEHLIGKWKLSDRNFDIVFYSNDSRACLSDPISQYLENGKPKASFEFDLIPATVVESTGMIKPLGDSVTPSTTASSTPVPGSPALPDLHHEEHRPEEVLPACKPIEPIVPITSSNRKSKSSSRSKTTKPTVAVEEEILPVVTPPLPETKPVECLVPSPSNTLMIPMVNTMPSSSAESVYKEMLDRERDIFMSLLESQARWMSQMQTQMTNTCLALQENAFRMLNRSRGDDEEVHEFKKQRKQ